MPFYCDTCGSQSCESLSGELEFLEEEIAKYKAKNFIELFELLGTVRDNCSTELSTGILSEEEEDLKRKALIGCEIIVAINMKTLSRKDFEFIKSRTDENFLLIVRRIYKKHTNTDYCW